MSIRPSLLVAAALLLLSASPARAQVPQSPTLFIGLGFGPTDTTPVSQGVPIYAQGDQIWVVDYAQSQYYLQLTSPNGTAAFAGDLTPSSIMRLYTFQPGDPTGLWTLEVINPSIPFNETDLVSIQLVSPRPLYPRLGAYGVTPGGSLAMNFTMTPEDEYGSSACAAGSAFSQTVQVSLPPSLGSGALDLSKNGSQVSVSSGFNAAQPFTFWAELHQNFSYATNGSSVLYSRDLVEAATPEVPFSKGTGSGTSVLMTYQTSLRTGLSTLWAYFRSQSGVTAITVPVLVPNADNWLPISSCTSYSLVPGAAFSLSASMKSPAGRWPARLYTMYTEDGVEGFSNESLGILPASAEITSSAQGKAITDSLTTVVAGADVLSYAVSGNTIYLLAKAFPLYLNVSLLPGTFQAWSLVAPFEAYTLQVPTGSVTLEAASNGKPDAGAEAVVAYQNLTVAKGSGGKEEFYLPAGRYTARVTVGNASEVVEFTSVPGAFTNETLDFTPPAAPGFPYPLLLAALVGAGASIAVWADVFRRRRTWVAPARSHISTA